MTIMTTAGLCLLLRPISLVYIYVSFFGKKTQAAATSFSRSFLVLGNTIGISLFSVRFWDYFIRGYNYTYEVPKRLQESRNDTRKWDLGLLITVREHLLCKFNEAMSALFFGCGEADQGNIKRVFCKGEMVPVCSI